MISIPDGQTCLPIYFFDADSFCGAKTPHITSPVCKQEFRIPTRSFYLQANILGQRSFTIGSARGRRRKEEARYPLVEEPTRSDKTLSMFI